MASILRFLESVKSRYAVTDPDKAAKLKEFGIGFASDFVGTMLQGDDKTRGLGKHFKSHNEDKIAQVIQDAGGVLIHRTGEQVITGGTTATEWFGEPTKKDAQLSAKSVMDFEVIMTSKRKDRDGDVLHPKGADVDPHMPLLWQHFPMEPIGKFFEIVNRTDDAVKGKFGIADTLLGRDAAVLVDFGALRFSHGFQPTKFEPLDAKEGEFSGWEVFEYKMMEGSLVSIPSNTDAVVTAFSRQKLHAPLVKEWAGRVNENRTKSYGMNSPLGASGGGAIVNPNAFTQVFNFGDLAAKALGLTNTGNQPPAVEPVKKHRKGAPPAKPSANPPAKKDDDATQPTSDDANTGNDSSDAAADDGESEPVMLADIVDQIDSVMSASGLPDEATNRLQVVEGIVQNLSDSISTFNENVSQAASDEDLSGIITSSQQLISDAVASLNNVGEELGRIANIADMPADSITAINDTLAMIQTINDALSAMIQTAQDVQDDGIGDAVGDNGTGADSSGGDPDPMASDDSDGKGFSKAAQHVAHKLLGLLWAGKQIPPSMLRELRKAVRDQLQPA